MVSNRPAALRGLLRANLLSEQVVVEYYFVACGTQGNILFLCSYRQQEKHLLALCPA